jgi:hypothetical protein
MRPSACPPQVLAILVVVAHLAAVATPCVAGIARPIASHETQPAHTPSAEAPGAHCAEHAAPAPVHASAPCPCGCDDASVPGKADSRLGSALVDPPPSVAPGPVSRRFGATRGVLPREPVRALDPVPI